MDNFYFRLHSQEGGLGLHFAFDFVLSVPLTLAPHSLLVCTLRYTSLLCCT